MLVSLFFVSLTAVSVAAIKVEVENTEDGIGKPIILEEIQNFPMYYASDGANIDSYLVPPDPHKPNIIHDVIATPATYLLPPSPDRQNEYFYKPTEPGEQTDWYPIDALAQKPTEILPLPEKHHPQESNEAGDNVRTGKELHRGQVISVPSRGLLPPHESAPNDFIVISHSANLQLPHKEIDHIRNEPINLQLPVLRPPLKQILPINIRVHPSPPIPYLTLPINVSPGYKNPTRLYPKKYHHEFKPVPIPVSQYVDENEGQIPTAKPAQLAIPPKQLLPEDDMKTYLFGQPPEKKHKLKQKEEPIKSLTAPPRENDEVTNPTEQEASETNYRHPGSPVYPSTIREEQAEIGTYKPDQKSKGERTEFRMHGMKGPHSYQFGFDTGKGKNRQFRYEERDNDGNVKGHYGYVDKFGKLRVVNYDADPVHGFRAESPAEKE